MRRSKSSFVIFPFWAWPSQRALIFLTPSSNHSCFASFKTTGTPFCAKHMAIPPPMSPAPRMPIFFSGAAVAVMPGTLAAVRSAKKRCRSALDCTLKSSCTNSRNSTFRPSSKLMPEQAARKQAMMPSGAIMPGDCFLAAAKAASKAFIAGGPELSGGTERLDTGFGPCASAKAAASSTTFPEATASTMPLARACGAFTEPPVRIICVTVSNGARRGKRWVPWPPGRRPSVTSGKATTALGAATL
mmetsp:Transcript_112008/g.327557  ORF Transcript_112008/g.327557 Transcript_112008/m.327557 type:complete len:245 (+) Transcript_112008:1188-1922(+)